MIERKFIVENARAFDWEGLGIFDTLESAHSWIAEEYNYSLTDFMAESENNLLQDWYEMFDVRVTEVPYFKG